MPGAARRSAVVIDAHEYVAGDPNCDHDDAAEHAPCADCGSAQDAFVHTEEARAGAYTLTAIDDSDIGYAAEDHARMSAPGPHTVDDPGNAEDADEAPAASSRRTRR